MTRCIALSLLIAGSGLQGCASLPPRIVVSNTPAEAGGTYSMLASVDGEVYPAYRAWDGEDTATVFALTLLTIAAVNVGGR